MFRIAFILAALLLSASGALADKVLHWEVTLDAPVADVWRAFTVEEEVEKWMVPNSKIDLRVGGQMLNSYDPAAELAAGAPGVIVHTYLAFEPERMIASRVTVPEGAPVPKCIEQAWSVVRFEPLAPNRTRVTLTSCGWGEGPDWDQAEEFFQTGNTWTLQKLKELFPSPSKTDHDRAFAELSRLVGGEWIHENTSADGAVFRVRNVLEHGATSNVIVSRGWLGNAEGMFPHGATQIWREPVTGEVRYQTINEHDFIARGGITIDAGEVLRWDWTVTRTTGEIDEYRVVMKFEDDDHYLMSIEHNAPDTGWRTMIDTMRFSRVDRAPEAFLKTIAAPAPAAPAKN